MKEIMKKYQQWKKDNPDEDYQYDEIHNFFAEIGRHGMYLIMENLNEMVKAYPSILNFE